MSRQKDKGTKYENRIVNKLLEAGYPTIRSPQMTHSKVNREWDTDVIIGTLEEPVARIECKHRNEVPKVVYNWLEENKGYTDSPRVPQAVIDWLSDNDFLIMKKTGVRYPDVVCMRMETFLEFLNGKRTLPKQ